MNDKAFFAFRVILSRKLCFLFLIIASNRQGASNLDFTQGEKHSNPVATRLKQKFSALVFNIFDFFLLE